MRNPKISSMAANVAVDAWGELLDGGFLDIYDGDQPDSVDDPITTQTRLASLGFGDPAFSSAKGGEALSHVLTSETDAKATGTATWYRCYQSDHTTAILDGTVGTIDSDLVMGSLSFQIHGEVLVSSFTLAVG